MNDSVRKQIANIPEFVRNWNSKADSYKDCGCDLRAIFDEFITRYIIFNILYKICAEIYGATGDRNSATKIVNKFLYENNCNIIPELKEHTNQLISGILEGKFIIGIPKYSDRKLLHDLQNNDTLALLKCIYQLRCNLFHGDKEFIWRQEELLAPATRCLEIINNSIYQTLIRL